MVIYSFKYKIPDRVVKDEMSYHLVDKTVITPIPFSHSRIALFIYWIFHAFIA